MNPQRPQWHVWLLVQAYHLTDNAKCKSFLRKWSKTHNVHRYGTQSIQNLKATWIYIIFFTCCITNKTITAFLREARQCPYLASTCGPALHSELSAMYIPETGSPSGDLPERKMLCPFLQAKTWVKPWKGHKLRGWSLLPVFQRKLD